MSTTFTWSQFQSFADGREAIETDVSEWDLFQWAIEETLLADPLANSHAIGADTDLRYFRTWAHPGTAHLPRLVVVFRIDAEPKGDQPGLLEGHLVIPFADLDEDDAPRIVPFLLE